MSVVQDCEFYELVTHGAVHNQIVFLQHGRVHLIYEHLLRNCHGIILRVIDHQTGVGISLQYDLLVHQPVRYVRRIQVSCMYDPVQNRFLHSERAYARLEYMYIPLRCRYSQRCVFYDLYFRHNSLKRRGGHQMHRPLNTVRNRRELIYMFLRIVPGIQHLFDGVKHSTRDIQLLICHFCGCWQEFGVYEPLHNQRTEHGFQCIQPCRYVTAVGEQL